MFSIDRTNSDTAALCWLTFLLRQLPHNDQYQTIIAEALKKDNPFVLFEIQCLIPVPYMQKYMDPKRFQIIILKRMQREILAALPYVILQCSNQAWFM